MTGADLRRMREAKGWSQHFLGVMSGVQQQSISNYEAGKTYIYKTTLNKLLNALNSNDIIPPVIDKLGIGKECHSKRIKQGLSVKQLAYRAGVDEITVVRLEKGEFVPTPKTVDLIMEVFSYDRIEDHPTLMDDIACQDIAQAIVMGALHDMRGLMIWNYSKTIQEDIKGQIKPRSDCNLREIANFFRSDFFSMICPDTDGIKMMHEYKEKCKKDIPEMPRIKCSYKGHKIHQGYNNNLYVYNSKGKRVYSEKCHDRMTLEQLKSFAKHCPILREEDK